MREFGVRVVLISAVGKPALGVFFEKIPVKGSFRVYKKIVGLYNRKILIAKYIAERTDFPDSAEIVRALNVKKQISHLLPLSKKIPLP